MHVVEKHGRNATYNFDTDDTLHAVRNGEFSDQDNNFQTKKLLCIDSFMIVWLLTLPENFKEWYEFHDEYKEIGVSHNKLLSNSDSPSFAQFASDAVYMFLTKN